MTNTKNHKFFLIDILLIIAIVGYCLPWLDSSSVGLQPGAYDLAEWMTLHPTVRATSSTLLPALLLRIVLPAIGCLFLINAQLVQSYLRGSIHWLFIGGIFIALIPALDFFRGQFQDRNYQQQFVVWITYGICCVTLIILNRMAVQMRNIAIAIAILCTLCAIWGITQAYQLMILYEIQFRIGIGLVICVFALTMLISSFLTQK